MLVRSGQELSLAGVERMISNGIQEVAQHRGVAARIRPVRTTDDEVLQFGQEAGVAGYAFLGGLIGPSFGMGMMTLGTPFVVVGAPVRDVACNCVTADYAAGSEAAVNHLFTRGRQRIGLVNGTSLTRSSRDKYRGFRIGLA